jgi:hypothetical protein
MNQHDKLISDFKATKWASNPFERVADIIHGTPGQLPSLVRAIVEQLPTSGTFLDAALSFLPLKDWQEIVDLSIGILKSSKTNESAESVVAYASLQCPETLHGWLDQLLFIRPNEGTYYEAWPWRKSGTIHMNRLLQTINESRDKDMWIEAWQRGLETRDGITVKAMVESMASAGYGSHQAKSGTSGRFDINDYLRVVGIEELDGKLRRLASSAGFHFVFPAGYVEEDRPWLKPIRHPTWGLTSESDAIEIRFGGMGKGQCVHCEGRTHNLFSSSVLPRVDGVFDDGPLHLETCLSCLGWEVEAIFSEHDAAGFPKMLNTAGKKGRPEFPAGPLLECSARLVLTPARWQHQDWALSNSRENLNRFGGEPCWIQNADYPACPTCQNTMPFLAQLDSDLPTSDGHEWLWGSGGICYVFWCSSCRASAQLWQCT